MMLKSVGRAALLVSFLFGASWPVYAEPAAAERETYAPARYGFALLTGSAYDPDLIGLVLLQGQLLLDYEQIFWHRAPDDMKIKFELNAGLTLDGRERGVLSVNMMALRYYERYALAGATPFVEAGIGLIYTDFRVDGQGLRFNFNPQVGFGFECPLSSGGALTTALRLHHLSNSSFYKENRGVNSALLLIGYLF
ncbi:MAG: acyloxyacyl hydrolase [Desulfuromonadales bacterium]|nr:acyloxyacyl hydrolase [Desulfuromonadales bacterium]